MFKKLFPVVAILASIIGFCVPVAANQSAQSSYCAPVYTPAPHTTIYASPLAQEITHSETCSGNPGDLFSDGPLYLVTVGFSSSSFNFTIPAMVWYVQGNRIYMPSTAEVAPTNATTYYWVDRVALTWTATGTNTAPSSTSILGYTVTSTSSGISGIVQAVPVTALLNQVTLTSLLQATTNLTSCFICYGIEGTASVGVAKFGNATTGSGYTAIGSGGAATVNGITDTAFGIGINGTGKITIDSTGDIGAAGQINPTGVANYNLASASPRPICAGNGSAEFQCTLSPLFATTGIQTTATGSTGNTYVQMGSNVSITTGVSGGPSGEWLLEVRMPLTAATSSTTIFVYGCIESASTYTVEDFSEGGVGSTCATTLTHSFAGTASFGAESGSISQVGLSGQASADLYVANSTTFTMGCYVAGSSGTSENVYGYCAVKAYPI